MESAASVEEFDFGLTDEALLGLDMLDISKKEDNLTKFGGAIKSGVLIQ
jgi:hypothetical protein